MKVLIPDYGVGKSGISTYRRELVKNLLKFGIDVVLLGEKKAYQMDGLDCEFYEQPRGISIYLPPVSRIYYCKKLEKFIKNKGIEFDLLHSPSPTSVSYMNLSKPIIVTSWFYPASLLGSIKKQLEYSRPSVILPAIYYRFSLTYEDLLAYRNSKGIICVTRKLFEDLSRKSYNSVYIPPGITVPKNILSSEKYNSKTLIFVAYNPIQKRKGLQFLLSALEYAISNKLINEKDLTLLVVGEKSRKLIKISRRYKFIKLVGILDRLDLLKVMGKSHMLVAPSIYEEFGYVVLEGMSCGLPIIASNIHSFQDLIEDNKNGYLVNPKNVKEFGEKLSILINDESKMRKFGNNSLKIVRDKFSWSRVIPTIKEFYQKCLEN